MALLPRANSRHLPIVGTAAWAKGQGHSSVELAGMSLSPSWARSMGLAGHRIVGASCADVSLWASLLGFICGPTFGPPNAITSASHHQCPSLPLATQPRPHLGLVCCLPHARVLGS
ncbi:hypothetical protein ACLOJK_026172 [Asimina triloba]